MRINIVKIGNSKGIRIPSYILKECKITGEVDIKVIDGKVIIAPVGKPREGWDAQYKIMHENQDDVIKFNDEIDLDSEDWEW